MSQNERHADRHLERLVQIAAVANHTLPAGLSTYDVRLINYSRMCMARLFLGIAVKLESGVKPQMPEQSK